MSNIDELFDRGDRHREELNELYRITKATDQRLGHGIHSLQSKIEATSNQISLQASANGRAIEASEASNRRIQDLKEIAEKGEGLAVTLDVHVKQTTRKFKGISDQIRQQIQQIQVLQTIVSTLTSRIESLEAIPSRRCTSCAKVIQPAKASHLKCEDCYLSKNTRSCTVCRLPYLPVHFSYKTCPKCYTVKKERKSKKTKSVKPLC